MTVKNIDYYVGRGLSEPQARMAEAIFGGFNWNGRAYKGAMRQHREHKREEAEARNKLTPHDRTRAHREDRCECVKPAHRRKRRRATREVGA